MRGGEWGVRFTTSGGDDQSLRECCGKTATVRTLDDVDAISRRIELEVEVSKPYCLKGLKSLKEMTYAGQGR